MHTHLRKYIYSLINTEKYICVCIHGLVCLIYFLALSRGTRSCGPTPHTILGAVVSIFQSLEIASLSPT